MADVILTKLREAFAQVDKARQAADSNFNDEAGDALKLCRTAFREAVNKAPEALDTVQKPEEMIITLNFLLKVQERKSLRKAQIKAAIENLFSREVWLWVAHKDEETKTKMLAFMSAYSDMNELATKLEEGPPQVDPKEEAKAKKEAAAAAAKERKNTVEDTDEPPEEESPEEITRRLIQVGLEGFRECNFVYPTGMHTEMASDDALEAFASNFYLGVSRLATAVGTLTGKGEDISEQEGIVKEIADEDMPKILNFLVTMWGARAPFRNKVTYCVDKLKDVSPRFAKVVDERSARANRLPWLPALPDLPEYPPIGTLQPPAYPAIAPRAQINAGDVCTVVWIDSRPEAFTNCKPMFDVGINVKGFHDDWSRGPSRAGQDAESYLVDALANPKEHIIGIIVNNGPTHKQMLMNLNNWNFRNGRPAPFCMACTMKGTYADFQGSGVTVVDKNRNVVEAVCVEEMRTRREFGGHKFVKDQAVVVFSQGHQGWVRATVLDIEEDGKVVVVYGGSRKSIPPHDFGLWLRAPHMSSVFWSLAQDLSLPAVPPAVPPAGYKYSPGDTY